MQDFVFREHLMKTKSPKLYKFLLSGEGSLTDAHYDATREWASIASPAGYPLESKKIGNGSETYYVLTGVNHASATSTKLLVDLLHDVAAK